MLTINIVSGGIEINGQLLAHPFQFDDFIRALGDPTKVDNPNAKNATYVWNDKGIRVFVDDNNAVTECNVYLLAYPNAQAVPQNLFDGKISIDGESYASAITFSPEDRIFIEKTVGDTAVRAHLTRDEPRQIKVVNIGTKQSPQPPAEKILPNKAVEPLIFSDFNFKLAIINELMFNQKVLTPTFNVRQYIAGSTDRAININIEGYDPIPEVVKFFEAYEIDASHAPLVTSLYIDGGNEIYRQLAPLWDGETDGFDIKSFADIDLFANLKEVSIELFPVSDAVKSELAAKGIAVH